MVMCACLQTAGCAILDNTPFAGTQKITSNIGENASMLNDAHSRALNGVILQNILRARDRWPKHYTVLSGITSEPQVKLTLGAELGPIGLGNPERPFGESAVSGSQDSTAALTYQSNPLEQSDNAYAPIPHDIFARYWNDGWPKDVLLILLVKSISIGEERYVNSIASPQDFKEYLKAVARLLGPGQCEKILEANGSSQEEQLSVCTDVIETQSGGATHKRSLFSLTGDHCSREVTPSGQRVMVHVPKCTMVYTRRNKKKQEFATCPLVETYGRLHLLNNRDAGRTGLLAQIEKLKALYEGKEVKLEFNEARSRFEVRICDAEKKDGDYEFVRLDDSDADEFFDIASGKTFKNIVVNFSTGPLAGSSTTFSRWADVKIEMRSVDDILNYLGEWLRTYPASINRAGPDVEPGEMVLKSSRCEVARKIVAGESSGPIREAVTPLFTVYNKDLAGELVDDLIGNYERDYAVEIEHAGDIYLAVPRPNYNGLYGNTAADCGTDRTSAVFALLSQLYIRSQSPAFLRAPEGGRVRVQ